MRLRSLLALALILLVTACRKEQDADGVSRRDNKVAPRVARLYFESASMLLVAEPRNLQLPQSPAAALPVVVTELLKGPVNPGLVRQFPADTVLRGAYLLPDGTAFVDLGGETLSKGWSVGSHEELMAVYSVVQTVTDNFPDTRRLRILVNGVAAETLAGHVALERSLHPDPTLLDRRPR